MVLKQAFNLLTRIHSRAATQKRLGTPNIYSPVRISPSNYFRFLEGPSATVIHGREFVIPVDTMKGHELQSLIFEDVPSDGVYFIVYGMTSTTELEFNATASDIQDALRDITGLEYVTVTGDSASGFVIAMIGVDSPLLLVLDTESGTPDLDVDGEISISGHQAFEPRIKRGDKIIDTEFGHMAIDEIIEMVDIGGSIMGYRVRME